ncbi:MAG: PIG-L family deacetylase [Chitinophagaceae bacterium]|nr:PIG-L family deacetylase [Chitinophagaceae bacterium]
MRKIILCLGTITEKKKVHQSIFFLFFFITFNQNKIWAQPPKTYTSSEILQQLKKLNVLGSVLYIAAHPDDENTRLLAYLANEKLYRTGYLSLTRGDGGQNLIGDEQGIELGLIRTQELLSARRIDGAEQYFSSAYDFGFCKSTDEALSTWDHEKILSDVVWVIRKFKPDAIITRFPEDSRAGHGHHSASAVLAREVFDAAGDAAKFPEQLKQGVSIWQPKRLLWNTFNFGTTNTQSDDQFKTDVGIYNHLLGKSYGEIAALSRSQHKSQGFGVPAQRGNVLEYFATIKGEKPVKDLLDGINTSWAKIENQNNLQTTVDSIINNFSATYPYKSVVPLVRLYQRVQQVNDIFWKDKKLKEIQHIIEACSGLFVEDAASSQYAVQGDSLKIIVSAINRSDAMVDNASVSIFANNYQLGTLLNNKNAGHTLTVLIPPDIKITQPYWLEKQMDKGSFNIVDQQLIGKAGNDPVSVEFSIDIEGQQFYFKKPVQYKSTDPVKGEIYQPLTVLPKLEVNFSNEVFLSVNNTPVDIIANLKANTKYTSSYNSIKKIITANDASITNKRKGDFGNAAPLVFTAKANKKNSTQLIKLIAVTNTDSFYRYKKTIQYDHIPSIVYFHDAIAKLSDVDLKTVGHNIGYISGAGDKVPDALHQMGYNVVMLKQPDLTVDNLKQFDAIITGIRAYNVHEWLSTSYDELMQYVKDGGVLLTQYNTNSSIGPVKAKIAPYPFTISRSRVTHEEAAVNFLLPDHPVLNHPNKISEKDFEGWIQERSIYNAENIDSNYQRILSMKDPGEKEQDGSLIISNYGKGRFIYAGLVFFRELPAGVPGAYRLFANLIANTRINQIK